MDNQYSSIFVSIVGASYEDDENNRFLWRLLNRLDNRCSVRLFNYNMEKGHCTKIEPNNSEVCFN